MTMYTANDDNATPECPASISGHCLKEAQSEAACDTEAGECVHGGQPPVDTLPEWLYQRYGRPLNEGLLWEQIDDGEKSYWVHQAAAVRRAVDRGGFKEKS